MPYNSKLFVWNMLFEVIIMLYSGKYHATSEITEV